MLPNKPLLSNSSINNNTADTDNTNTDINSSVGGSFQANKRNKTNPKMDSLNISNKPTGLMQQTKSSNQSHHHSHHHHHLNNDSKLYVMSSIEIKDPLENTIEDAYNKLKHLIISNNQQPDNIQFNELSNYSNQSKLQYDEVCNALLYSILTDPANCSRCLRNLFLCNNFNFSSSSVSSSIGQSSLELNNPNTSYAVLINNLNSVITENYQRLLDTPRQQLIWLLRELVKARVNQCERLLLQMLRNIQSGSLTEKNYWLAESMLDILSEIQVNQSNDSSSTNSSLWIYSSNELMTQTLYTYLRIIADHGQAVALTQLRQRETEFCIQILREKWTECMQIGRDLVRLLENLAKIPEFEQLWRDITQSPQVLSPQFAQLGGLAHLMRLPTRRRCLISRLTIDMERKIYFIITSVKAGQQKRYLDWFQRQYLNTPESQSLRVDILRYILVVVHPTNEQLNSGLTPRWSLCAWLINTCTNQIELANLKLALFFDWLFYDAKKDNIMLIEPAILLMFNSIRSQTPPINSTNNLSPNLTNSLFDFLCRIALNYYWPYRDQILNGIMQSFKDSVDKRVIPSMQVFFANINEPTNNSNSKFPNQSQGSVLAPDLKVLIQNTFGNFFQTLNINQASIIAQQQSQPQSLPSPQQQPPTQLVPPSISPQPIKPTEPFVQSPSFGSGLSLFKQRIKNDSDDSSSGFSDSSAPSGNVSPQPISFTSYFKTEPTSEIKQDQLPNSNEFTSLASKTEAQFSSDDDEDSKPAEPQQVNNKANLTIQKQMLQFTTRPFKIFTSLEECQSSLINNQNMLENHLNLIQSDDIRDKLTEFNEKVKELNTTPSSSSDNLQQFGNVPINSFNYLSTMFKDIINLINKDTDILNNFHTSLTDLAVSLCLILKNDFNNQLLPNQIYSKSNGNSLVYSLFSPNTSLINMISENTLSQRLIFVLFKELSQTTNQSSSREILIQLLHEIYLKQNRIGYYFLFFIYLINLKSVNSNIKSKTDQKSLIEIYLEFTKERRNEIRVELKQKQQQQQASSDDDVNSNEASESQSENSLVSSNEDSDGENDSASSDTDDELLDEEDLVLGECFMQDIRLCQQDDPYLFCFMLPFILKDLHESKKANFMINNSELCYLICSCIDAKQLKDLISSITSQELILLKDKSLKKTTKSNGKKSTRSNSDDSKMNKKRKRTSDTTKKSTKNAKKKSLKKKSKNKKLQKQKSKLKKQCLWNVLEASLVWESIEQIFFWQLLNAHDDIDLTSLLPLYGKLDSQNHSEATYNLFQIVKTNEPTFDLIKFLINRRLDENSEKGLFVHWTRRCNAGDIKIAQIFCKLLNKSALATNQSQSQSTLKKIKINESNNNKKLTAEQQLEIANQQKASNRSLGRMISIDMDQIPSLDLVLSCLFRLRLNNECIKFILNNNMLETLQKIYKKYCDDDLKKKYSDLFTLADEFSENDRKNDNDNDDDEDEQEDDDDENNVSENESNEDENSSDSNDDSDSNEAVASKNKKLKSSPRTTKNSSKSVAKTTTKTKSTKRTIKSSLSSKTSKKQKIKNSNSSDSDREDSTGNKRRSTNNSKDITESEESNSDEESDSSTERKKAKNSRKK